MQIKSKHPFKQLYIAIKHLLKQLWSKMLDISKRAATQKDLTHRICLCIENPPQTLQSRFQTLKHAGDFIDLLRWGKQILPYWVTRPCPLWSDGVEVHIIVEGQWRTRTPQRVESETHKVSSRLWVQHLIYDGDVSPWVGEAPALYCFARYFHDCQE